MHKILQWFPITFRVNFKFLVLVSKTLSDWALPTSLVPSPALPPLPTRCPKPLAYPQTCPVVSYWRDFAQVLSSPISLTYQRLDSSLLPLESLLWPYHSWGKKKHMFLKLRFFFTVFYLFVLSVTYETKDPRCPRQLYLINLSSNNYIGKRLNSWIC